MVRNIGFDQSKEERTDLGFFKIFQSIHLSSECMRAFPYKFIKQLTKKDFSYKMVIRAQWGYSWDVKVSKNTRFYYIEKPGWDQFVIDNALGENEFITFTHKGKMVFDINIYEQNGKEMLVPRKPLVSSSGIKKEKGESSYKKVKKEEETDESLGRFEPQVRKKKRTEAPKITKKEMKSKKVKNGVEKGESSRGAGLRAWRKKVEVSKASKKKKKKIKSKQFESSSIPEFEITIRKSYLKFLAIPKQFVDENIPNESKIFKVYHPNGKSWKVLCLVREIRTIFSGGYSRLAREYPLLVGDVCIFKLIKPYEFLLVISRKAKEEITRTVREEITELID